jgi:hypothetical protein
MEREGRDEWVEDVIGVCRKIRECLHRGDCPGSKLCNELEDYHRALG